MIRQINATENDPGRVTGYRPAVEGEDAGSVRNCDRQFPLDGEPAPKPIGNGVPQNTVKADN